MLKVIETNKDKIKKETKKYNCSNNIYGLLLKTGVYMKAKDIIYQIIH